MSWEMFYLTCFLVGVTLSLIAFVGGSLHLPHVHFHLSHGHAAPGVGGGHAGVSRGPEMPVFNFATITAFLAWFGGIGYILSAHSPLVGVIVLAFAIAGGLGASWTVFKFMVKLMNTESSHLKDEDYRHEGLVCTVTMPVRANGTGEIMYMQNGVRRSAGARSCNGKPLEKGAEVVIERYENGVAYVHR